MVPGFCFAGRERPELICPSHNTDTGKLFPLWEDNTKGKMRLLNSPQASRQTPTDIWTSEPL